MIRASAVLLCWSAVISAKGLCVAPPSTNKLLDTLPALEDLRFNKDQRLGARWRLVQQYPTDLFVQLEYQNAIRNKLFLGDEWDRALAFYRSKPSDPMMRFLEARLIMATDGKAAQRTLRALTNDQDPRRACGATADRAGSTRHSAEAASPHSHALASVSAGGAFG
jgi:hypothetical protein